MLFLYTPTYNNNIMDAKLRVMPKGLGKEIEVSWQQPEPLLGIIDDDSATRIVDYARGNYMIDGIYALSVYDADKNLFHDTPIKLDFRDGDYTRHTYFGYADLPMSYMYSAGYETSTLFRLRITSVVVPWVTYATKQGDEITVENVHGSVLQHVQFRQKQNAYSYGSEDYPQLAWPWQDTR